MGRFSPASIWRIALRTEATYPGAYFRDKHVARRSERVKDVNDKFSEVAKECADKPLPDFNECVADGMEDFSAPGTPSKMYEYAKAHRFVATRVAGKPRAKILGSSPD